MLRLSDVLQYIQKIWMILSLNVALECETRSLVMKTNIPFKTYEMGEKLPPGPGLKGLLTRLSVK